MSAWAPTGISAGAGACGTMVVSFCCGIASCSPGVCEQAQMLSDRNTVICERAIKRIGLTILLLLDIANIMRWIFIVKAWKG